MSEYSPQQHPGSDSHIFFSKDVANAQKKKGLGYDCSQHIVLGTEEKQDVEYCFRAKKMDTRRRVRTSNFNPQFPD